MRNVLRYPIIALAGFWLALPCAAQISIRNLPQTAPGINDLFPFAAASGGTWSTPLSGILAGLGSYVLPPSTVLNCTAPIRCNNANSAYLNTPVTVSITTSAFVTSGRQLTMASPLLCDGAATCDLSADRTISGITYPIGSAFGGTGTNTSGSSGIAKVTVGTWSFGGITFSDLSSSTSSQLRTVLSDETGVGSAVFATGPTMGDISVNQVANGDTAFLITRATNSSPTGYFEQFIQPSTLTALWQVDYSGTLLTGTIPVARITGLATSATTDATNASNISAGTLNNSRLPAIAHSSLTGLTSGDDHTQYVLLAGRSGGQTLTCGTGAGDGCIIKTTSNATGGKVTITNNSATVPAASGTGTILHLAGADTVNTIMEIDAYGSSVSPLVYTRRARGTAASPSALNTNDVIGGWQGWGYGSTGYSSTAQSAIQCIAAQTWTDSNHGTQCDVYTTPLNSTTVTKAVSWDAGGHQVMSGTGPTVTCTGTGTSPSTPTVVGTDNAFTVTMFTGTGSPGNTGTCTITFHTAFGASPPMACMLVVGASSWGNEATIQQTTESASAPVITWTNEASTVLTALVASSNYKFSCIVMGR